MSPLEATIAELDAAGIRYRVEAGKHYKVRFTVRSRACLVVVSRSSGDRRASLNARHTVRRAIREAVESSS